MHFEFESVYSTALWQEYLSVRQRQRLGHAILLVGADPLMHARAMAAHLLCNSPMQETACGQCRACQMLMSATHPDFRHVAPEGKLHVLKVDAIRELAAGLELKPHGAQGRVLIIEAADRMNIAAANALLKVLESPPEGTYFILTVQSVGGIPQTILSRCQRWYLTDAATSPEMEPQQALQLITAWIQDANPIALAKSLEQVPLEMVISCLMRAVHACIAHHLGQAVESDLPIASLAKQLDLAACYQCWDVLLERHEHVRAPVALNTLLFLETLFITLSAFAKHKEVLPC